MALPFRDFLQNLLGGEQGQMPAQNLPPYSAATTTPSNPPNAPVLPSTVAPQGSVPIVQQPAQSPVMDPRTFALFQQQQQMQAAQQARVGSPDRFMWLGQDPIVQEQVGYNPTVQNAPTPAFPTTSPTPPVADPRNGVWQTVVYRAQDGTNYYILMPIANTVNLPPGATLFGDPIANEPDKVQRAIDEGEKGKTGDTQKGVLSQMPENIQILFPSTQQEYQQGGVINATGTGEQFLPDDVTQATTQAPQVNAQGHTEDEVFQQQREFDQMSRDMMTTPPDQFLAEQKTQESLTINQLAETNPEGAALIRSKRPDITSIPADQMVVQYGNGNISLVPASNTPPQGATIITYGGASTPPNPRAGDLKVPLPGFVPDIPLPDNALGELLGLGVYAPLGVADAVFSPVQEQFHAVNTAPTESVWIPDGGGIPNTILVQGPNGEKRQIPIGSDVPDGFSVVPRGGHWEYSTQKGPVGEFFGNLLGGADTAVDWIPGVQQSQDVGQAVGNWWLQEMLPGGFGGYQAWQAQHPDIVAGVQESGYNGFTGDAAVWERYQADRNAVQRLFDTVTSDPTNLILGEGTVASSARRGARELAEEALRQSDEVPASVAKGSTEYWINQAEQQADNVPPVSPPEPKPPTDITQNLPPSSVDPLAQAERSQVVNAIDQIFRTAGDVISVPDQVMNELVDLVIRGGGGTLRGLGQIPIPGGSGRNLSDLFRTTNESVVTHAPEEVRVQLEDVRSQTPNVGEAVPGEGTKITVDVNARDSEAVGPGERGVETEEVIPETPLAPAEVQQNLSGIMPSGYTVSPGVADGTWTVIGPDGNPVAGLENVDQAAIEKWASSPDVALGRVEPDRSGEVIEVSPIEQRQQAAIQARQERAANQAGTPQEPVVEASLATQEPQTPVVQTPAQQSSLQRDTQYQRTKEGQATQTVVDTWQSSDPDVDLSYLHPQSGADRAAGVGRVGEDFRQRPIDVARSIAPQYKVQGRWQRFVNSLDKRLKRKGGYIERETDRQTRQFDHFKSDTTPGQGEHGLALRRAHEVLLEADHLVRGEGPFFVREFGDTARLPEYQWKRWNYARGGTNPHTALDTLDQTNGRYMPGTDLGEATELAIFHPEKQVRDDALNDITDRLSLHNPDGTIKKTTGNANFTHPKVDSRLKDILSNAKSQNLGIRTLRRDYEGLLEEEGRRAADSAARNGGQDVRLTPDDVLGIERDITRQRAEAISPQSISAAAQESPAPQQLAATATPETVAATPSPAATPPVVDGAEPIALGGTAPTPARGLMGPAGRVETPTTTASPAPAATPAETAPSAPEINIYGEPVSPEAPTGIRKPLMGKPIDTSGQTLPGEARLRDEIEQAQAIRAVAERRSAQRQTVEDTLEEKPGSRRAKREDYLRGRSETRALDMSRRVDYMSPTDYQSFSIRGRNPGATQAAVLSQKFGNGETILARWDKYSDEYIKAGKSVEEAEELASKRVVGDYTVEILSDEMRIRYDAEYKRLLKSKEEDLLTGEMRTMNQLDAQINALNNTLRKSRSGKAAKVLRFYDRVLSGLRKTFLYNWLTGPRYIVTQMAGNAITAGLTGHSSAAWEILSPASIRRAYRTAQRNGELPPGVMDEVLDGYGLGGRREGTRGSIVTRDQTLDEVGNTKPGRSLLGKYTVPIADKGIRQMSAAYDQLAREALWAHWMDRNMLVPRSTLRERMLATVPAGADANEVARIFGAMPQRFSADDLREAFGDIDSRWADRHARDWQEALTKTDMAARKEVNRVFFSGTERNIDLGLKRVMFFHYWMSRAVPLYTEAIARNPLYLYNYTKMIEAMKDDDDLSGTKFFRLMSSPMGYNILIRPDAFLATFASLGDESGYEPDGESRLGKMLRESPVMLNPLIMSALNMAGVMGDTFAPDPVGANKFIGAYQAVVDNINAQLGLGLKPVGNYQEWALRHIRETVSGTLDPVTPDWMLDSVPYSDEMAYKENEVRSIIAEIALSKGLSLDDPIVTASFTDPESELYQEAMKRYALQDAVDIAARIIPVTAVLYPKSQLDSPKERTLGIGYEKQVQQQLGMTQPTPRGERLMTERDTIAAATDYSRNMQQWQDEYRNIGGPEARGAWSFYNSIRYGGLDDPIVVSGQEWSPDQVSALDDNQREQLANTWASEAGVADMIEQVRTQREQFRADHPEYDAYVTWSAQLNDYEGGAQQWWTDAVQGNPNAAQWYNILSDDQKADGVVLTSLPAYMAYTGDKRMYWDAEPIATRSEVEPTPYNPIDALSSGDGSSSTTTSGTSQQRGPTKEGLVEDYQKYQADLATYNAAASQMLGQEVNVDYLNPYERQFVVSQLSTMGLSEPRPSGYLSDYFQWASAQGQGSDSSVDAYLAYYSRANPVQQPTAPVMPVAP